MNKEDVVYAHNGILLSHKKNKIMPFAATLDELRDSHTKWTNSEKETNYITYKETLKNYTNELI